MKREDLIYPELCYKIVGILYDVFNEIGSGHRELIYQKSLELAFKEKGIKFQSQVYAPISYKDRVVGKNFLDFLIEGKIVLEIKKDTIFRKPFINQVYSYLKAKNLKLGIIANFTREGVRFKRIVNIE